MKKLVAAITIICCIAGTHNTFSQSSYSEISDPIEPVNRGFFWVNDKLHTYLINPITIGWSYVIPRPARLGLNNFVNNVQTPFSALNNLLQGKAGSAGNEVRRFLYNTTIGVLGVFESAEPHQDWEPHPEDIGQTFAVWGVPEIMYLNLPVLGTTTLRDIFSSLTYRSQATERYRGELMDDIWYAKGISFFTINSASLFIGRYEEIKDSSTDPYTAIRDGWFEKRTAAIEE